MRRTESRLIVMVRLNVMPDTSLIIVRLVAIRLETIRLGKKIKKRVNPKNRLSLKR